MGTISKGIIKKVLAVTLGITMTFGALMLPNKTVQDGFSAASAYTNEINGCKFTYKIDTERGVTKYIITGVENHGETVEIPAYINHKGIEHPITEVSGILKNDTTVKTIIYPDTVTRITGGLNNSSVENIVLPDDLEYLGVQFASNCKNLKSVKYNGTKLAIIGDGAFLDSDLSCMTNEKGAAVLGSWLIKYTPKEGQTTVKISDLGGDGVKIENIAYKAYYSDPDLTTLDLEGIKIISALNFWKMPNLVNVLNSEEVETVDEGDFTETPWYENAKEKNLIKIGKTLIYYYTKDNVLDLTSGKLEGIKKVAPQALVSCKNIETLLCNSDCVFDDDCLYVNHPQTDPGESPDDDFPLIPTYNIKKVFIDGKELSCSSLLEDPKVYSWFKTNYSCFMGSQFINSMIEEKTIALFKQMDITYYGLDNDMIGKLSPAEEFNIRLKIHSYMSIYPYDHHGYGGGMTAFLMGGEVTCYGYAYLTHYLLECAGVETKTVKWDITDIEPTIGKVHFWNTTKIGDEWFESDDGFDAQAGHVFKNYFLSTSDIEDTDKKGHSSTYFFDSWRDLRDTGRSTTHPIAQRTLGDIDGNDERDKDDVTLLWRYLCGKTDTIDEKRADINFDGKVDVSDYVLLKDFVNETAIYPDNIPIDGMAATVKVYFLNGDDYANMRYAFTDRDGYIKLPDMFEPPEGKKLSYDIGKVGQKVRITTPLTVINVKWIDENEPDYILGDVTDNGLIDIEDAVAIIQHINGMTPLTDEQEMRADVTKDENIDIDDAVTLISYINGNITF